jgi:hypothetical protein
VVQLPAAERRLKRTDRAHDRRLRRLDELARNAPREAPHGCRHGPQLEVAVQGGHLDAVRALLRAGAAPDGRPQEEHAPLGQAAWRGHAEIVAELVRHGASLVWEEGSPIGAALHGSRHCQDPEGGPTMRTYDEVPKERYAKVVSVLLDAGAAIPERLGDDGPRSATTLTELGLDPPD